MVILLTYGPDAVSKITHYNHLLDTWFPKEIEKAPKVVYYCFYSFVKSTT